jgi:hypothetical protein
MAFGLALAVPVLAAALGVLALSKILSRRSLSSSSSAGRCITVEWYIESMTPRKGALPQRGRRQGGWGSYGSIRGEVWVVGV